MPREREAPDSRLCGNDQKQRLGIKNVIAAIYIIITTLLFPHSSIAQQQIITYYRVQSGTGFFVNRQYVITNEHVVRGCSKVYIKGAVPERKASVKVADEANDLALLETDDAPPAQFAPLRFNIDDLKVGDRVLLMGYPGESGARGQFSTATAQIEDMHDLEGSKGRYYITDVVEHGNSGGPVFDTSGNVIGVVVAKSTLYTVNADTQQQLSQKNVGVVIGLTTLKQFLFNHGIYTEWMGSSLLFSDSYIQDNAKAFTVNVQCRNQEGPPKVIDGAPQPNVQHGVVIYER